MVNIDPLDNTPEGMFLWQMLCNGPHPCSGYPVCRHVNCLKRHAPITACGIVEHSHRWISLWSPSLPQAITWTDIVFSWPKMWCYWTQNPPFTNRKQSGKCLHFFALQWRRNERDGVSNHRRFDGLLNCLFRRGSKKTSKLRVSGLCEGIHRWPVNSPHKGPVTPRMFPFDDDIMVNFIRGEVGWLKQA